MQRLKIKALVLLKPLTELSDVELHDDFGLNDYVITHKVTDGLIQVETWDLVGFLRTFQVQYPTPIGLCQKFELINAEALG